MIRITVDELTPTGELVATDCIECPDDISGEDFVERVLVPTMVAAGYDEDVANSSMIGYVDTHLLPEVEEEIEENY